MTRESQKRYEKIRRERQNASRSFIAIDSEGGSIGRSYILGDKRYQPHKSFLWGAGNSNGGVEWLYSTIPLKSEQIIEWLLGVGARNSNAIFISFSFGYDVAQILADWPYEKAWELQHGKEYSQKDNTNVRQNNRRLCYWNKYACQYLKGKQFSLWDIQRHLRNDANNRRTRVRIDNKRRIRIYDAFGFFQTSFLKAIRSMPGIVTEEEYKIVEKGKSERGEFYHSNIAEIKEYTRHELMILCRMMNKLRAALQSQNVLPTTWYGAGSIAQALMKREGTRIHLGKKRAKRPNQNQIWSHHAFFGGRIELIKQGATKHKLYGYDIASAYPAAAVSLSSMEGGTWRKIKNPTRSVIESSDTLSICHMVAEWKESLPFYPLPYRMANGCILFPRRINGFYMLSEAVAALELFGANCSALSIPTMWQFRPASNVKPFQFLQTMFDFRASLSKDDITQMVIKLGINSVYGKLAQAVGQFGRAPTLASPWHAAAITAWTRARLLRAAMLDPGAIVAMMTDGIISERPLPLPIPATKTLGAWEGAELPAGGVFIQSGVYAISEAEGGWKAKSRGFRPTNVEGSIADFLRQTIPQCWKNDEPNFPFPYKNYMTLGASVVSDDAWKRCGQWAEGERTLDLRTAGQKRYPISSIMARRRRATNLISTEPSDLNILHCDESGNLLLSAPHKPEWLDADFGNRSDDDEEQDIIEAGFT